MIDHELRARIQKHAEQFLNQGRKDWDLAHTKAVADWILILVAAEHLDELTMFTAAWFHDIGYYGLFGNDPSNNWDMIKDRKKLHMVRGAESAGIFLTDPANAANYSPEQAQRIQHLISVHDEVELLSDPDEIALGVADTLGAIDVRRVTPTFDYEGYQKYRESGLKRRERLFQTELTKKIYQELLPLFVAFFEQKSDNR